MKTSRILVLYFLLLVLLNGQESPFNRGVNLSNWFQSSSPNAIHFTKYTKQDFENIKSLGADVIRLPINLHSMTNGSPYYEIDPLFLSFLDETVNWAEELQLNLILDNHTFDPSTSTDPSIGEVLIPVWKNMAEHFKDRSKYIYYEILNEPHGISDNAWNEIQKDVIEAIRTIDTIHTIIVGPSGFNSYNNLQYMPQYEDDNLLYTFHFYDPFLFTHQGASWTDPSLVSLGGVPFPYDQSRMPDIPDELQNTWVAGSINSYNNVGTISYVRDQLDIAVNFKESRNVPLFCGEFGVYIPNSENNDRILWYNIVRTYLEAKGIGWTSWDYHGGFGIFNTTSFGMFEHDLNTHLLAALGFNIPPQTEFELKPDSTGFSIYSDFIATGITSTSNSSSGLDFYDVTSHEGNYTISWSKPVQYNSISFNFIPLKDLSYLEENDFEIGFWIKGNFALSKFQIRFVDTKEDENDHPWRMSFDLDYNLVNFDNDWHYISIPLKDFRESGSWDNEWFNPQGLFDWKAVDKFEIVNEFDQISNADLWFDELEIYDPNSSTGIKENYSVPQKFVLKQNYPNPFNPTTKIEFVVPNEEDHKTQPLLKKVVLKIYDILGNEISTLVNEQKAPGIYAVEFDAVNLPSGTYFYKLTAGRFTEVKKMIILK